MNTKQTIFVNEYLKCWNASEAARRAGYNGKSNVIGPRLLADVSIKKEVDDRIAELKMSADEVLVRLANMARADIAEFVEVESPKDLLQEKYEGKTPIIRKFKKTTVFTKSGDEIVTTELELYDAQAALEKLGRAHGIFTDRQEVSGPGGTPIQFTQVEVQLPNDTVEN